MGKKYESGASILHTTLVDVVAHESNRIKNTLFYRLLPRNKIFSKRVPYKDELRVVAS